MAGERDEFNLTSLQKRRFELFLHHKSISVAAKSDSVSVSSVRSQVLRMIRKLFVMNLLPSFPYDKNNSRLQFFDAGLGDMPTIKKNLPEISAAYVLFSGKNRPKDRTDYVFISKDDLIQIIEAAIDKKLSTLNK